MTNSTATEGPGRRTGLDRSDIVFAALTLVENEGADALTMRRLAAELDITTNTVYWHVGGRDELVLEIIREQSRRLAERPVRGRSPRTRVLSAAGHIYQSALDSKAITRLAHQAGAASLLEHPLEVALASELEGAGLTGRRAAAALRSILTVIGGFLVLALRDESAIPEDLRGTALWGQNEADVDPATRAALAEPANLDALFDSTLKALVENLVPS